MENQMEKKMENEMEAGLYRGYMVVPLNGGTQNRPQNDIILILRATRRAP